MEAKKTILDLSDEILLLIVSNVSVGDVINLSQTSARFDRLLEDRTVSGRLIIPWNAGVQRQALIQFLVQPNRASVITCLTLNDLY